MPEAGLILNNPNIFSLAQYMVGCASPSVLDSLDVNLSYSVTTAEGRYETLFLEI
jgi:hypothetical protein